ncbi:DUF4307 domain-containing protein [Microbacterium sp.]|uniref:DUF4307 domain-containing protein n=1 Tax=Microbacterium sp. TaxID=51671 RepID=UPI0039E4C760
MTVTRSQAELDDRYGRRRGIRGRVGGVVFGVVALAIVGSLGWATFAQSLRAVDADTLALSAIDAHSITVEFQTTAQPGSAVACVIEAQDAEHGIVGWIVREYPADQAHTRTFTETVPTIAPATTGLVTSCWIP